MNDLKNLQLTLQQKGVIVVKNIFQPEQLLQLKLIADQCFFEIETLIKAKGINHIKSYLPEHYQFLPHVTSLNILALNDYDSSIIPNILNLVKNSLIQSILIESMGEKIKVNLTQSWLRKQYAPCHSPRWHHSHSWHQDGCLWLNFPTTSEAKYLDLDLTNLITLWLPLTNCGKDAPCLQFITKKLTKPLHFNYLQTAILQTIFEEKDFYTPQLTLGDGVIFLKGTLHQTYVNSQMINDRISVEFRFFLIENKDKSDDLFL